MTPIFFSWRQAVLKSQLGATTKHVLLTLGCHMNEIGESCFPSIELLCEETSLSNRAIITNLRLAEEAGFIATTKHGFSGKKWARNEYKATFPPIENCTQVVNEVHHLNNKAVNLIPQGSEPNDMKAVNQVHTSTSINSTINTTTPRAQETIPEKTTITPEGSLACRLIPLGIAVTSMHPTLCQWVKDQIPIDLILQSVQLARQNKPSPEKIAANYLNAIIRDQLKPKPLPVDNSWKFNQQSVDAKARELKTHCPSHCKTREQFIEYLDNLIAERRTNGELAA